MARQGMKLVTLAQMTGIDQGHLSRMRKGRRGINMDQAKSIAAALGVTPAEVLGLSETKITSPAPPDGFTDDWQAYDPGPSDPFRAFLTPNRYWITVEADAVSSVGPARRDLALIDDSAAAVKAVKPLAIVVGLHHPVDEPDKAQHILRQFVPPNLLITNGRDRARTLVIGEDDVHIIGVVVRFHRALGG